MNTIETLLTQAYDLEQRGELAEAARLRAMAREQFSASSTVQITRWASEGSAYTDFTIGDGLTKVLIGSHSGNKSGIELIIGGDCINSKLSEVITLADVRQLRDNLTALLNDARLASALGEPLPEPPGAPAIRAKHLYHDPNEDGDLTDQPIGPLAWQCYSLGTAGDDAVTINFDVDGNHAPDVDLFNTSGRPLDRVERTVRTFQALLTHADVQAARAADTERRQKIRKPAKRNKRTA